MDTGTRFYSLDGADEANSNDGDSQLTDGTRENDMGDEDDQLTAGGLTNTKSDAKSDGGDQANVRGGDSTILGADGAAGGLSSDGARTDEYDAAVLGLGD